VIRGGSGLFYDRYTLANLNRALEINGQQAFHQIAGGAAATAVFQQSGGGSLANPSPALARSIFRANARLVTHTPHNPASRWNVS
jgi:hypothetical protein